MIIRRSMDFGDPRRNHRYRMAIAAQMAKRIPPHYRPRLSGKIALMQHKAKPAIARMLTRWRVMGAEYAVKMAMREGIA